MIGGLERTCHGTCRRFGRLIKFGGAMNKDLHSAVISALAVTLTSLALPDAALAQEESRADAGSGIEEITVTARRRDENLMEVPVAISVMTSEGIQSTGVKDVIELSKFTPGLFGTVDGNGRVDRSQTTLNFRGLSIASGLFFIDGAPYAGSNTPDVTDAERVEVLKGPQSVYFGRSTFSGAVNFVTRQPSDTFQGRISVEGTSYDGQDLSLTFEGPVSDNVGVRVRARHYSFGGYYKNGGDPSSRMGKQSTNSISAIVHATPTDRLTIKSLLSFTEDDDGVPNTAALKSGSEIFCDLGGAAGGGAYYCGELPTLSELDIATVVSVNDYMDPFTYSELIENAKEYPVTFDPTFKDGYGFRRQTSVAHLNLDYLFDSGYSLQSISAWHYTKTGSINDQVYRDGRQTPNPLFGVLPNVTPIRQFTLLLQSEVYDFSQELRITSPQERRMRATFGANYFRRWGPPNTNSGIFFAGRHTGSQAETVISTPAVFGGVYYDLTDTITLGVEGRYQWDKIEQQAIFPNTGPVLSETFASFSPRITLDYKYADNSLLYGLYSRGYQPGGFNTSLVGQPQSIIDQIAVAGSNLTYDEEILDNFEFGLKSTWLDHRLRTIIAAYYSEWSDGQVVNEIFVTRPDGTLLSTSVTANIGEIELKGLEFEGAYSINDKLILSGTLNYSDNEIKNYNYIPGGIRIRNDANVNGNQLDKTPTWSWTLSPTYTDRFNDDYDWYSRLDWLGNSKIYVDPTNVAWIGASSRVNLRVGLRGDALRLEAFVTNLLDDDTLTEGDRANDVFFSASQLNEIRIGLPDKRTFGISASYEF